MRCDIISLRDTAVSALTGGLLQGLNSRLLLSSKRNDRKALFYFTAIKVIHMSPSHLAYYFKMLFIALFLLLSTILMVQFAEVFNLPAKCFVTSVFHSETLHEIAKELLVYFHQAKSRNFLRQIKSNKRQDVIFSFGVF